MGGVSSFNTTTEVSLSKTPNPQLLPGRCNMAAHCSGCVFTQDGLNAENTFHCWLYTLYIIVYVTNNKKNKKNCISSICSSMDLKILIPGEQVLLSVFHP